MYKAIFCDLDDTLLNADKSILQKNKDAIKEARAKGIKFVVCTGRVLSAVEKILEELELKGQKDEFLVSLNGGVIWENNGTLLYNNNLPKSLAEAVFQKGINYDICIRVYTKDSFYGYNLDKDEMLKEAYGSALSQLKAFSTPNLDFLKDEELVKIVFITSNREQLEAMEAELKAFSTELELTYSSHRSLEVNNKGANKGAGLLWLAKHLGFKQEEVIAIGDNFNDISMLQSAGLGVCVKNGDEAVKKIANYITQNTNEEGAVAEVIHLAMKN